MRIGETYDERMARDSKYSNKKPQISVIFALIPHRLCNGQLAWMELVIKEKIYSFCNDEFYSHYHQYDALLCDHMLAMLARRKNATLL